MHKLLQRRDPASAVPASRAVALAAANDAGEVDASPFFFLGGCADFYEEIASIKRAHAQGRLAAYLTPAGAAPPASAGEFALRTSARLFAILRQQEHEFRRNATVQEIKAHNAALYVMAALADEIFILELDWPGREAWLEVLIEHRLFKTRNAGSHFFNMAQDLVQIQSRDNLYVDLAAVFLLALALGFRGRYRGPQGQAALHEIRLQLYKLVNQKSRPGAQAGERAGDAHAFMQAYRYNLQGREDERLAPVSPWLLLGGYAALGYLVLSLAAWMVLMHPFEKYLGG